MREIEPTTRFRRDYKREFSGPLGKKLEGLLRPILDLLAADQPLPQRHRDHPLAGEWQDHRNCHIRADGHDDVGSQRRWAQQTFQFLPSGLKIFRFLVTPEAVVGSISLIESIGAAASTSGAIRRDWKLRHGRVISALGKRHICTIT